MAAVRLVDRDGAVLYDGSQRRGTVVQLSAGAVDLAQCTPGRPGQFRCGPTAFTASGRTSPPREPDRPVTTPVGSRRTAAALAAMSPDPKVIEECQAAIDKARRRHMLHRMHPELKALWTRMHPPGPDTPQVDRLADAVTAQLVAGGDPATDSILASAVLRLLRHEGQA